MAPAYTVAATFHIRADGIGAMKQIINDVTAQSLSEDGCQIYHWSQGAEDPAFFLLYMEWLLRGACCFAARAESRATIGGGEATDGARRRMAFLSALSRSPHRR